MKKIFLLLILVTSILSSSQAQICYASWIIHHQPETPGCYDGDVEFSIPSNCFDNYMVWSISEDAGSYYNYGTFYNFYGLELTDLPAGHFHFSFTSGNNSGEAPDFYLTNSLTCGLTVD